MFVELDGRCDELAVGLEGIAGVLIADEVFDECLGLCIGLFSILSTVRGEEEETFDDGTLVADGVVTVVVVVVVVRRASLSNEPVGPLSIGFFAEYCTDCCCCGGLFEWLLDDEDEDARW